MNRLQIPFVQLGFRHLHNFNIRNFKLFSTDAKGCNNEVEQRSVMSRDEVYRQLENLDFKTAAKILFTDPPKKKKFGLDFHLVQLFFACLPSLAVYLVAQYARSEMKRMDAELHQKRKRAEDEVKAREAKQLAIQERSENELVKVKHRLDVLEETVKDIADQTKKIVERIPPRDIDGVVKKSSGSADDHGLAASSEDGGPVPAVAPENNSQPSAGLGLKSLGHQVYPEATTHSSDDNTKDERGIRVVAAQLARYFRDR